MIAPAVAEAVHSKPNPRTDERPYSSVKLSIPKFVRNKESEFLNPAAPRDFMVQFRSWLRSSARGAPMHEHLLNAMEGTVAVAFAVDVLFEDNDGLKKKDTECLTDEVISEAFMTRFGQELRPHAELAREKLHQNKIRMNKEGSEGLLPYIGTFRDVVRDVPDMSPGDQVAWFQPPGSNVVFRPRCKSSVSPITRAQGFPPWLTSLPMLCVNRKHEVARNVRSLATPSLNAFQTSYPNDDYKKQRRGDYHSNDHTERSYDSNCDPNSTLGHGY